MDAEDDDHAGGARVHVTRPNLLQVGTSEVISSKVPMSHWSLLSSFLVLGDLGLRVLCRQWMHEELTAEMKVKPEKRFLKVKL